MAKTKFTPETRGVLLERVAAGVSFQDACRVADVRYPTLKRWLKLGRDDPESEFAEFAAAVDSARQDAADRPEPMTEEEHRLEVSEAGRRGSVAALKLYWEMILDDRSPAEVTEADRSADPLAGIDQLAERRAA